MPKALWHWWALVGISCLSEATLSTELPVIGRWGMGWDILLPPQENGVEGSACCLPPAACQKHCSNALPFPGLSGKGNHLLNTPARCWNMLWTRGGKVHHIELLGGDLKWLKVFAVLQRKKSLLSFCCAPSTVLTSQGNWSSGDFLCVGGSVLYYCGSLGFFLCVFVWLVWDF